MNRKKPYILTDSIGVNNMDRGVKTTTPTTVMTRDIEMKFDGSNPLLIRTIDEAQVKAVNIAKIMLIIMLLK